MIKSLEPGLKSPEWHNPSVLEVTHYAQNNASIMWKSLIVSLLSPLSLDSMVRSREVLLS